MKKVTIWIGRVLMLLSALILLAGCRSVQPAKPQLSQEASQSVSEASEVSKVSESSETSESAGICGQPTTGSQLFTMWR